MVSKWMINMVAAGAILCVAAPATGALDAPVVLHRAPLDPFHYWSDKDLASLVKKPNVSVDLSDHEFFFIDTIMRDTSGMVEVHDRWNDYLVIQKGDGAIAYGGKAADLKEVTPGEWRGATNSGAKVVLVHPGDLIVIPAGMAHQMRLNPGRTIRYLAFKARQ
jgi:mannose-6-phosphate isomerase-like protein (cupin superfamily)